ncbi:diacylglycerol O-acyltransferase [Mycobacterium saskatchewanense]|uniref:diacylglycerol O-acyltransferase n=1 Tax=Mycobacterium saskatchewanense TaxID=220927 RepID=A0AAJ3NNK5_9MYCO|nr:wax ester/triacylglycerol synthase domain-containing protein [Mycobacterium saskatchewanense]ORW68386.1 diacylglycerol O-acyltransferase [Mycobacterium saskatchewanense]BBX65776.1 diacylglycerol O-acyltransferase [Mycobacterium saskatchewanense]
MVVRLSGTDALSLHTQSSRTPAHTVTLVIIDASDQLSHERLHQLVATSLPQLARFRSRLVTKPLGVGQPVWAEIDDYDPSPQIHRATVRAPGGRRELADLIAELSAGRQDGLSRLWEAWSIDGLAGGRWALAVKMSPALNDGAAGAASVWPRLLTTGPHADPANNLPAEPGLGSAPSVGDLVTDVMTEIVENHVAGMWLIAETVSGVLQAVSGRLLRMRVGAPMAPVAPSMSGPVPHTVFNALLTKRRAVALASIPLADVKTVSNAFGGSITNVVLAACTLSLRAWLQRHDKVPDDPLLMRMPFELPAADPPRSGRALAMGRLRIPVHLDDPVQVLANLHTATERLNAIRSRSSETGSATVDLATVASLTPPTLARLGMRLYTRSGLRRQLKPICHGSVTHTVSHTAGESVQAYCAGAKIVGMHSVAPLAEDSGLSIALTSHGDDLDVSVCACPDNVPAIDDIATGIMQSVDILVAAAQESPRGQGRSVVTEMTSHPANRSRGQPY